MGSPYSLRPRLGLGKKRLREVGSYHALFTIPDRGIYVLLWSVLQKRGTVNEVNTRRRARANITTREEVAGTVEEEFQRIHTGMLDS